MEIFDVVDEHDKVIGNATRDEVHEKKLIHRAVTVFVFNTQWELFMILRSRHKSLNPLKRQASASWHVESWESYTDAAKRELKEELNINDEVRYHFTHKVFSSEQREFFQIFSTVTNQIITTNEEIEEWKFMSIQQVKSMITKDKEIFRDGFIEIFNRFLDEWM